MSVYTIVERDQLNTFLSHYDLGSLISYRGINAGIVNTNYFVTTQVGEVVLTLFEQLSCEELPYFLKLMAYLAEHEVPCPKPLADETSCYLRQLNGKPAALFKRILCGEAVEQPTLTQCQVLGTALGHFHTISPLFPMYRPNEHGSYWRQVTAERVLPLLNPADATLLQEELHFQAQYQHFDLPRGVIHADLFRDNTLFEGDKLCGILDFYYACNDVLLYDLAITVNDWCTLPDGRLDKARAQILFDSYEEQRALTYQEYQVWPVMLRVAALRFWLSRLQDWYFPRPGELTHTKNPLEFRDILLSHIYSQQLAMNLELLTSDSE